MTLRDWLLENGLSPAQFAQRIGRRVQSVHRYLSGERIPDRETMAIIFAETGHQVTANDFHGLSVQPAQDAA